MAGAPILNIGDLAREVTSSIMRANLLLQNATELLAAAARLGELDQ
jgi:hypothetical protein